MAHQPILPVKLIVREGVVGSDLKMGTKSVQDTGLGWVKEASAHRPAEDMISAATPWVVILTGGRTGSVHGWLLPSHEQGWVTTKELVIDG